MSEFISNKKINISRSSRIKSKATTRRGSQRNNVYKSINSKLINKNKILKTVAAVYKKYDFQSLVSSFPNNLCIGNDEILYVTPTFIDIGYLNSIRVEEYQFTKLYNLMEKHFEVIKTPISTNREAVYSAYLSIIDNPEKNMNNIFFINLLILLGLNSEEFFFQNLVFYKNESQNEQHHVLKTVAKAIY
jgi:hypothetical protein